MGGVALSKLRANPNAGLREEYRLDIIFSSYISVLTMHRGL
jgi:hypothetical protein